MQLPSLTYRQFFEIIPDAALVVNRATKIVLANSHACVLFGYQPGELEEQSVRILLPETKSGIHGNLMEGFFVSPQTRPMGAGRDLFGRRKDSREFPVDIMLSPAEMDGALVTVCIVRDLTQHKQLEAALRQSEENYRLLVENASEIFYKVSLHSDPLRGQVTFVSQQCEAITGHTASEFIHDPKLWGGAVHPGDLGVLAESTQAILSSRTIGTREYRIWHSTRQEYSWVEDRVIPLFDSQGNVIGYQGVAHDITKRKEAAEAAKLFRALIDQSNDAIEVIDPETGRYLDSSEKAYQDLGYSREEFLALSVFDVDLSFDQASFRRASQALGKSGSLTTESEHQRKDGSAFPVEVNVKSIELDRGYIVAVARDITGRKQAEEALRKSESSLREAQVVAGLGSYVLDFSTGMWKSSDICDQIFGIDAAYARSVAGWADLIHPADRQAMLDYFTHGVIDRRLRFDKEYRIVRPNDHAERWVHGIGELETDAQNQLSDMHGTITDITERKQAELELRLQATALDAAANAVMITDREGVIQWVNPAFSRITGFTAEQAIGHTPRILKSGLYPREFYDEVWRTILAGGVWQAEMVNRHRSGSHYSAHQTITPLRGPEGEITHFIAIQQDISERKQAAQDLAQERNLLRTLIDNLPDHIYAKDRAGRFIIKNLANARQMGAATPEETLGKTDFDYYPPELAARYYADDQTVITSGQALVDQEEPITDAAGRAGWILTTKVPLRDGQGQVIGLVGIGHDITERKQSEQQIQRQVERLAALRAIHQAITDSLDLRVTLGVFLGQVEAQLGTDASTVLLLDARDQTLTYVEGRGFRSSQFQKTRVRLGEGRAGRAALERRIVVESGRQSAHAPSMRTGLLGQEEFVSYYGVPLIAKGRVVGVLELFHRAPLRPDPEWLEFLDDLAGQAAVAIDNATVYADLQRSATDLRLAYDSTLEGWSRAMDLRDHETEGHTQRVTEMTLQLAKAMGVSGAELTHMRRGALLHDIGKIGVPDSILLKPGKLTGEEWATMRTHPQLAFDLLAPIAFLRPALDIPYCHHEKWDGTGYPRGLKGEEIPFVARIFAVADVWDALKSDRPYRAGWSEEQVKDYFREQAGKHFDPQVIEKIWPILSKRGAGH